MQKRNVVIAVSAAVVLILAGFITSAALGQQGQQGLAGNTNAVAASNLNVASEQGAANEADAANEASATNEGTDANAGQSASTATEGSPASDAEAASSAPAQSQAEAPAPVAAEQPKPAPPVEQKPQTITVHVCIDASRAPGYGIMDDCNVTLPVGASVYDALLATGAAVSGGSSYVRAINGLAEKLPGYEAGSGWMYLVDGSRPGVSCNAYKLHGDEDVRWVYTLDMGNDL